MDSFLFQKLHLYHTMLFIKMTDSELQFAA